jgi:site-specific DNA recombinase
VRSRIERARRDLEDAERALQQSDQQHLIIARIEDFTSRIKNGLSKLSWHKRRQVIRMPVATVEIDEKGAIVVFRVPPAGSAIGASSPSVNGENDESSPQ